MDIRVGDFLLAESVPAYLQHQQLYIDLEIFLEALEFPIQREDRTWSGWFRRDDVRFSWSMERGQPANSRLSRIYVRRTDWLESDEGIFVATGALDRWFSLDLRVDTRRQILTVKSDEPLPFQERLARDSMQRRHRGVDRPDVDVWVPDQYHWFTLPMFDLSTHVRTKSSRGASSTANTTSLTTALDLFKHSIAYTGSIGTSSQTSSNSQNRITVERKAATYDGDIALGVTHYAFGDVFNTNQNLVTRNGTGSGFMLGRGRSGHGSSLGRTTITGDAAPGWAVELYRNSTLLEFGTVDSDGRYTFLDQDTGYGENLFTIKLYGPQGQIREQHQVIWGGSVDIPVGDYAYNVSHVDYTRRSIDGGLDQIESLLANRMTDLRFGYALTEDLQIGVGYTETGVLSRDVPGEFSDENYLSLLARTNVLNGLLQAELAQQLGHGSALELQYLTSRWGQTIGFEHRSFGGYESPRTRASTPLNSENRIGISGPLKRDYLRSYSVSFLHRSRKDGLQEYRLSNRLGILYKNYSLGSELDYVRVGGAQPSVHGKFRISGRRGIVNLRAELDYTPTGADFFNRVTATFNWDLTERWNSTVTVSQSLGSSTATRFDSVLTARFFGMDFSVAAGASTQNSWAIGLGVNTYFAYDKRYGGFSTNHRAMAGTGRATFNLFIDRNGNNLRDTNEPLVDTVSYRRTGGTMIAPGTVAIRGLSPDRPLRIDTEDFSFDDPFLVPRQRIYELYTHAGSDITVDISVVETGDIEGYVYRDGQNKGARGVEIVLVDRSGKEVARTRSAFDGYYTFDLVPAGEYEIRVKSASGEMLRQDVTLDAEEGYVLLDAVYVYQ